MLMNQTFNREEFMNTIMLRLLSAVSMVVVAILGADLLAAETPKKSTKASNHAKKPEAKPTVPVVIAEKTINEVEELLGKAIIVDARGGGEKAIKGAIFLAANADDQVIHTKLNDETAEIIVYCGSVSCPASRTLAERLIGLGYTNIAHYAGGIKEWTENNKPTDDAKEKTKA